ncbi:MAG TPA: GrpB family protein [Acidimicrobiia bacterium]
MSGPDVDDPVEIVEYDARWTLEYDDASDELRDALSLWLVEIAHIGSTAVPGLAAKPVIDTQIGVKDLAATSAIVNALEPLGYEYVPELEATLPFRRYFRRSVNGRVTHQIHLVERSNTEWWERHIAFRDWLCGHPDDRDRYGELKKSLAIEHQCDRAAYTDAKTEFVQAIERQARIDTT